MISDEYFNGSSAISHILSNIPQGKIIQITLSNKERIVGSIVRKNGYIFDIHQTEGWQQGKSIFINEKDIITVSEL